MNRQLGVTPGILIAGELAVEKVLKVNLRRIPPFFRKCRRLICTIPKF